MIADSTNVKNGTFVNQCNNLINLAKANADVKFRVLGYKREPKYLDKFNNKNKRSIQTATDRLIKRLVDAMNTLKREERILGFSALIVLWKVRTHIDAVWMRQWRTTQQPLLIFMTSIRSRVHVSSFTLKCVAGIGVPIFGYLLMVPICLVWLLMLIVLVIISVLWVIQKLR